MKRLLDGFESVVSRHLSSPGVPIGGFCLIVAIATFVADLHMSLGMMLALPYATCVIATLWLRVRWTSMAMAGFTTLLCLLGLTFGATYGHFPVTQRMLALVAIWVTAGVVLMRRSHHQEMEAQETLLGVVADQSPIMIWMSDADDHRTYYNAQWLSFVGSTLEHEIEQDPFERVHPADYDRCFDAYVEAYEARAPFQMEYRLLCHDGEYSRVLDTACPLFSDKGEFEGYVGFCRDLTDRMRTERSQRGRSLALEKIASRRDLDEVLTTLIETAESVSPDLRCAIAILDDQGTRFETVIGQAIPAFYRIILTESEIGPSSESLGQAVRRKQRVIVEDVMSSSDWESFRDYARRAEFRTCWAEPVIASDGSPLGAIGMFYRNPRVPDAAELEFIRAASCMAAIALEGDKDRRRDDVFETQRALTEAREMVSDLEQTIANMNSGVAMVQEEVIELVEDDPEPAALPQVLVVDSRDDSVFYVSDLLVGVASVSSAENDILALNMVRSSLRREAPYDVVLINVDEASFDCPTVVKQIRDEGFLGAVVGLVNDESESRIPEFESAGGNSTLTKPFGQSDLEAIIQSQTQGQTA